MENNRETKTIELSKNKVEIYTYITGGEKRQVTEILTEGLSASATGEAQGQIPLSVVYKSNDKALELLVVSFDGSKDDVVKKINDLPSKDYDLLISEINKITQDSDFLGEKKK